MRRISRIDRSIDLLRPRIIRCAPSPYLCAACKYQAKPFSTSPIRGAPAKTPFTEKVRQRIWGTDQPPGQEDPYGDASVFDKTKKGTQEAEVEHYEEPPQAPVTAETPGIEALTNYQPAYTWDGLEEVGGFNEEWDPDYDFQGFLPAEITTDSAEVTAALHRAMVEVFAIQAAGKQLVEVSSTEPGEDLTYEVQLSPSATGATLHFSDGSSIEQVVKSLAPVFDETKEKGAPTPSEEDVAADRSIVDPLRDGDLPASVEIEEASENRAPTQSEEDLDADRSTEDPLAEETSDLAYADIVASWDPSWLQISLENPEVKFAVLKRTMQLTGIRVPDSVIRSTNTAQALLDHLITPPKPRKLVEALAQKEDLLALPNVTVLPRRVNLIDKERQVGRWKIIEEELHKRGLPIKGYARGKF